MPPGHLQLAHDIVARSLPATSADEPTADEGGLPDLAPESVLVRSIGGALDVFATVMARGGIVPLDEIASVLGIYADVSSRTSVEEGWILGCWSATLREVAQTNNEKAADSKICGEKR